MMGFSEPRVDIASRLSIHQLFKNSNLSYPAPRHRLSWSTKKPHLDLLYHVVKAYQPKTIIETGTFEAHGTFAMAAAAHENDNGANIFTIDYDGDPLQDKIGSVSMGEWLELKKYRNNNIEDIKKTFHKCSVDFIEGDSREVLPKLLESIENWDFWYQDSMHFEKGIKQEWDIMEPRANASSLIIFDDISIRNGFSKWFKSSKKKQGWKYRYIKKFNHKQCWAQRAAS